MNAKKFKILYIAGSGRSGSTILDNILGAVPGFFSAGEISYIWERGVAENRLCGCGVQFRDCQMWRNVLGPDFDGIDDIRRKRLSLLYRGIGAYLLLPLILNPWQTVLPRAWLTGILAILERLYASTAATTGARVVVDSSKFPSFGYALSRLSCADLYVVHVVRDPRAVAYSLQRKKRQTDGGARSYVPRHSPIRTALQWVVINRAADAIRARLPDRYILIRYEDFMTEPEEVIARIVEFLGENSARTPFVEGRTVQLGTNHTVSGNPNRFHAGTVVLRLDDEWESQMGRLSKAIVSVLTWPMRRRYGYIRTKQ